MPQFQRPAARPCGHCPYRQDVPSGVWAASEYAKLPPYDSETFEQPTQVFGCHLYDRSRELAPVCAGWAACHDTAHLMSLRFAGVTGNMTHEELEATMSYESPIPVFGSGQEAAAHGMKDIDHPSPAALAGMAKIERTRTDLQPPLEKD